VVTGVRTAPALLGRIVGAVDGFNRRHPWSHNDHFHGWIVRGLPMRRGRALDVGCGHGQLVELLADRFAHVDGVDVDADMAEASRRHFADDQRVTIRRTAFDRVSGSYDLITMVAVLHHMDLQSALQHAARLLSDEGRLLVVGLARAATPRDRARDLASTVLNPIVGLIKHPRAASGPVGEPPFPVLDPVLSFEEIKAVSEAVLPGARMRRRLFFRYTLEWTRPPLNGCSQPLP
jgi:SAM-dependent methyltransferase